MKILLDTRTFLWYISGDKHLPPLVLNSIQCPENEVYLSVVSLWEVIIKYQIGKIALPQSPEIYLPLQCQKHMISSLNVDEDSVRQLIKLPSIHRNPFDRLLICQAIEHGMTLATVDANVQLYPVRTM